MGRPLRVVVVYPDLLGTYGDGGNGLVLARRAERRGIAVELVQARSEEPVPAADVYTLGGGEDGPQVQAADRLARDSRFAEAVEAGAVVLAVCAGYQILGERFPSADGTPGAGLGLLDVVTVKGRPPRAVGEIVVDGAGLGVGLITGFENHGGTTTIGPGTEPLGPVKTGEGNDGHTDGARKGRIVGTYLHGPVLARNPALADLLLTWASGRDELEPLDDSREQALRAERLRAALGRRRPRR
jgi:CobQ-like glutamine amidotransferase family enzyme